MQLAIYQSFSELPPAFDSLFESGAETSVFFSREWFELLVENCLLPEERLRIYAVLDDRGEAMACLPCYHHSGKKLLQVLENFYSSLYPVYFNDEQALRRITDKIAEEKWHRVQFKPLAQGAGFDALRRALRNSGLKTQDFFCFGNWYLRLEGRDFETYYQGLSSKLRNTIKRRQKKLDKETQNRIVLTRGDEDLETHIKDFVSIYNRSWKKPEPFAEFIPNFIRLCRTQGWLRMGLIYVEDKPAAAQIWTVYKGIAYIYKLAYDEDYGRYSIGSILTKHLMQWVMEEDAVVEIDYLTGDDNYKKDWMSHRRERWGCMAFNPRTFKGLLMALKNLGGRRLKALIRRA